MATRLGRTLPQPLLPDVAAAPAEVDAPVVVVSFPVVVVVVVEVVVVVPQSPASRVAFMLALPSIHMGFVQPARLGVYVPDWRSVPSDVPMQPGAKWLTTTISLSELHVTIQL